MNAREPWLAPDWAAMEAQDWVVPLRDCPQEPEFHAEGDVWTHTRMVVDALRGLPEFHALDVEEKGILFTAALLHDVAKPICTVIESGKISSPRHAKIGERVVREMLWGCDFAFRERVCALVRLHGLPLWGLEKPDPVRAAILAGWRVRNELTYLLAKADVLGRITTTQAELLYRLELYRELCIENQCFDQERTWFNTHSRFRYFWSDETYPTEQFDDTQFEMIVLSGIAGSGKDTFYQKKYAQLPLISLDEIRKELKIKPDDRDGQGRVTQLAYERAKELCRKKQSFVWNSTNLSADLRARLIGTLRVYGPSIRIVYVEAPQAALLKRREMTIHKSVLERMQRQLEMPLLGEGHVVEWVKN